MDVMKAVSTRSSQHHLAEPAPSLDEFVELLGHACRAPDHGRLQPWRWILLRGNSRTALGSSFASACDGDEPRRAAALPLRAPLLATLVFAPRASKRVPVWEQLAAAVGMNNLLMLLLHDRGFGSIWRTGRFVDSADVRVLLDLRGGESLLGWLYIGTAVPGSHARPRPDMNIRTKVSVFDPSLCLIDTRRCGDAHLRGTR